MKAILAEIFSRQTPPPGSSEGLPYWTFWLLLCVILLLIAFIFLRDKDLRRRINLFFFGAKKKFIKLRLQARLKREYRKKAELISNLGKKAWEDKRDIPKGEKNRQELDKLEQNKINLEQESNKIQSKITDLETDLEKFSQKYKASVLEQESAKKPFQQKIAENKDEERAIEVQVTQKQKELEGVVRGLNSSANDIDAKSEDLNDQRDNINKVIKDLVAKRLQLENEQKENQEQIEELDKKLRIIEEEGKKRIREFHREIKEWKRNKDKVNEKIKNVEKKKEPLFVRLGKQADEARMDHEELSLFYSQIDRSNERIGELEEQIKNL